MLARRPRESEHGRGFAREVLLTQMFHAMLDTQPGLLDRYWEHFAEIFEIEELRDHVLKKREGLSEER